MPGQRILTVLHEGTMTGAPLAGVRAAHLMRELGYDVAFFCVRKATEPFARYVSLISGGPPILTGSFHAADYDGVVCHSAATADVVTQLLQAKRKVAWWIHEDTHFFDLINGRLINPCLKGATALVFASHHCAYRTFAPWVWERHGFGVHVIPNCVDSVVVNRPTFTAPVIAHVATLSRLKGTDIVVQLARLTKDLGWKFKLIGRAMEPDFLVDVPENVLHLGEVPPETVLHELGSCSHLFHPTRLDNQPLVILEALARGVPVVSSFLPSIREYADETHGIQFLGTDEISWPTLAGLFTSTLNVTARMPRAFHRSRHESSIAHLLEELL